MAMPTVYPIRRVWKAKNSALFFPFVVKILFCNIQYLAPARNCPKSAIALNSQGFEIPGWAILSKRRFGLDFMLAFKMRFAFEKQRTAIVWVSRYWRFTVVSSFLVDMRDSLRVR